MSKTPRTTTAQKAEGGDIGKPRGNKLAFNKETLKDLTVPDAGKVKGGANSRDSVPDVIVGNR